MSVFMEKNGVWECSGRLATGRFYGCGPAGLLSSMPHVSIFNLRMPGRALRQINTMHSQKKVEVRPAITIFEKSAK